MNRKPHTDSSSEPPRRWRRRAGAVASVAIASIAIASSPVTASGEPRDGRDADTRLQILVTNDDGWRGEAGRDTPYIAALRDALVGAGHEVVVVAPATDQSAKSASLSLGEQTLANPETGVWTLTGTPTDSVLLGIDHMFDGAPDLVVSGINPGGNFSQILNHSGTVGAATTALQLGIPAIAVSIDSLDPSVPIRFAEEVASYTSALIERLVERARGGEVLPDGVALNVNYPACLGPPDSQGARDKVRPRGSRVTVVDPSPYLDLFFSPTGDTKAGQPGTYRFSAAPSTTPPIDGSDREALAEGFVSITPIDADRSAETAAWARLRFLASDPGAGPSSQHPARRVG